MSNGDDTESTRILGGVWREEIRTRRGRLLDELSLRARDQSETDASALRLDVAERLSRVEAVVERP